MKNTLFARLQDRDIVCSGEGTSEILASINKCVKLGELDLLFVHQYAKILQYKNIFTYKVPGQSLP